MTSVPVFAQGQIKALAQLLGEYGTGDDITRVFRDRGVNDASGESTKWKRLYWYFQDTQQRHRCANHVLDFIGTFVTPARFVGHSEAFEAHRQDLNTILAFSGLEYGADGKFRQQQAAQTLDEAERRVRTIRARLHGRRIHAEVLKYCRTELMQDNYFHAVFEACKGLFQRIRDLSGVQLDGTALIDMVFAIDKPLLALNTLRTETEKSEHKGFATLLKGCHAAIRNPLAHEPKILWQGEDDAADYFSLISLLHRKLDECVSARPGVSL